MAATEPKGAKEARLSSIAPNNRMKIIKGLAWLNDVVQILVLDRFDPRRKRFSEQASTSCRELRFHSRTNNRHVYSSILGASELAGSIHRS